MINKSKEELIEEINYEHEHVARLLKSIDGIMELIQPYMGDFTGINEQGAFDIVLAVKEVLDTNVSAYKDLNEKYKTLLHKLQRFSNYNS